MKASWEHVFEEDAAPTTKNVVTTGASPGGRDYGPIGVDLGPEVIGEPSSHDDLQIRDYQFQPSDFTPWDHAFRDTSPRKTTNSSFKPSAPPGKTTKPIIPATSITAKPKSSAKTNASAASLIKQTPVIKAKSTSAKGTQKSTTVAQKASVKSSAKKPPKSRSEHENPAERNRRKRPRSQGNNPTTDHASRSSPQGGENEQTTTSAFIDLASPTLEEPSNITHATLFVAGTEPDNDSPKNGNTPSDRRQQDTADRKRKREKIGPIDVDNPDDPRKDKKLKKHKTSKSEKREKKKRDDRIGQEEPKAMTTWVPKRSTLILRGPPPDTPWTEIRDFFKARAYIDDLLIKAKQNVWRLSFVSIESRNKATALSGELFGGQAIRFEEPAQKTKKVVQPNRGDTHPVLSQARAETGDDGDRTIYISRLHSKVTPFEIQRFFFSNGKIEDVVGVNLLERQQGKKPLEYFGYITFGSFQSYTLALGLSGRRLGPTPKIKIRTVKHFQVGHSNVASNTNTVPAVKDSEEIIGTQEVIDAPEVEYSNAGRNGEGNETENAATQEVTTRGVEPCQAGRQGDLNNKRTASAAKQTEESIGTQGVKSAEVQLSQTGRKGDLNNITVPMVKETYHVCTQEVKTGAVELSQQVSNNGINNDAALTFKRIKRLSMQEGKTWNKEPSQTVPNEEIHNNAPSPVKGAQEVGPQEAIKIPRVEPFQSASNGEVNDDATSIIEEIEKVDIQEATIKDVDEVEIRLVEPFQALRNVEMNRNGSVVKQTEKVGAQNIPSRTVTERSVNDDATSLVNEMEKVGTKEMTMQKPEICRIVPNAEVNHSNTSTVNKEIEEAHPQEAKNRYVESLRRDPNAEASEKIGTQSAKFQRFQSLQGGPDADFNIDDTAVWKNTKKFGRDEVKTWECTLSEAGCKGDLNNSTIPAVNETAKVCTQKVTGDIEPSDRRRKGEAQKRIAPTVEDTKKGGTQDTTQEFESSQGGRKLEAKHSATSMVTESVDVDMHKAKTWEVESSQRYRLGEANNRAASLLNDTDQVGTPELKTQEVEHSKGGRRWEANSNTASVVKDTGQVGRPEAKTQKVGHSKGGCKVEVDKSTAAAVKGAEKVGTQEARINSFLEQVHGFQRKRNDTEESKESIGRPATQDLSEEDDEIEIIENPYAKPSNTFKTTDDEVEIVDGPPNVNATREEPIDLTGGEAKAKRFRPVKPKKPQASLSGSQRTRSQSIDGSSGGNASKGQPSSKPERRYVFHFRSKPASQESNKKNTWMEKDFNANLSHEDAVREQERLLRDAAARMRTQKRFQVTQNDNYHPSVVTFSQPAIDVQTRFPDHWKLSDPFSRLGLPKNSPLHLVKTHYRTLARFYHPDKSRADDTAQKFQAIAEAYHSISNT